MEPNNRNSQRMQRQSSYGATSQPAVHGSWMGAPLNKQGIVMIPTPGINSNGNDEQWTPNNHLIGPPSNWKPVAINPVTSNIFSRNEGQPAAAHSHRMGAPPNQQPAFANSTPSNNYNGSEVQPAATSHRMGPSPNQQPAVMNRTHINTFCGNEVQSAAYGHQLGPSPNQQPIVMISNPSNVNTNGNEVQSAAPSHLMGTPQNCQSIVMIPSPGTTTTSNAVQPEASQTNVTGTGSLYPSSSITSNSPPAGSNSEALTNRAHHNLMVSSRSPFGAQGIDMSTTMSTPNFSWPRMDQNSNFVTPYANQRSGSTSNLLQNPQFNSSWRPHANPQGAFSSEQHRTAPQASINRSSGYLPSTSININGVDSIPTSSNCPPMVRPPSQQKNLLQANAMKQKPMESACWTRFKNYNTDWNHCQEKNVSEDWKKFVAHYYAPEAKRMYCHAAFPGQSTIKYRRNMEAKLPCVHCETNNDNRQEVAFVELAIFFQHKFTKYQREKLDYINPTQFTERRQGNNSILLSKHAVVEKATDGQFMYIRKGRLLVAFNADMKIFSWQFCMSSFQRVDLSHAIACDKLNNMLRSAEGSSSASRSLPTSCHQTQNQPISNSTYPSSGANNKEVNLPAPIINSTNIFDTSAYASGCRPVTAATSSSINPNAMINPLHAGAHINARSLAPGTSDSTNNLLKRVASTENGPVMDDFSQRVSRQRLDDASSGLANGNDFSQRVTRQRLDDASSGLTNGNGSQNLASTASSGLATGNGTQGLAVNRNVGSGTNQKHWSGINIEDFDTLLDPNEVELLESLGL